VIGSYQVRGPACRRLDSVCREDEICAGRSWHTPAQRCRLACCRACVGKICLTHTQQRTSDADAKSTANATANITAAVTAVAAAAATHTGTALLPQLLEGCCACGHAQQGVPLGGRPPVRSCACACWLWG